MLFETAQEFVEAQKAMFFRGIAVVSAAAGTTLKGEEGVPTIDNLRKIFREMEFDFDENGQLSPNLRLYVAPQMEDKARELMAAAHEDPEIREILFEKRRIWMESRAKKRHRKLS